jgi:DNA polymerase-1
LRAAAKIAGSPAMIAALAGDVDFHTRTAQRLLGREEVTKADRAISKAINFGVLYGMGAEALRVTARLQYGVELTLAEARRHRQTLFETYPQLGAWYRRTRREQAAETRTLTGRRRLMPDARYTQRLNTPVQGLAADGLKRAMGLLWERREQCPGARLVAAVHDELIVECDAGQEEAAQRWLEQAMSDGVGPLLDPVPVTVECACGPDWSCKG